MSRTAIAKALDVTGEQVMSPEKFESIPKRTCACGTILSRYNQANVCFGCQAIGITDNAICELSRAEPSHYSTTGIDPETEDIR